MYLTQSNVIRGLAKQDYTMLREMCQYSNNLYNVAAGPMSSLSTS